MSRFVTYGVNIDGTLFGGVTEQSMTTGAEVNSEVTAGGTSPQFGELATVATGATFTAHSIAALLIKLGAKGFCMDAGDADPVVPGFGLWKIKKEDCGTIATGSVHDLLIIPNGLVVPRTLTVQQGQRASLTCEVFGTFDGTNDPIIEDNGKTAPTGITDLIGFHLGPTTVAGVALEKITQITIDFGIEVTPEYDDGDSFPKSLHVGKIQPTMTITTHDVAKFGAAGIPLTGAIGTHANTHTVLRKRAIGTSAFVTAAEHAKFSMAGVVTAKQVAGGSTNAPHSMEVMVTSLDDATNDMIDMDFAHSLA